MMGHCLPRWSLIQPVGYWFVSQVKAHSYCDGLLPRYVSFNSLYLGATPTVTMLFTLICIYGEI